MNIRPTKLELTGDSRLQIEWSDGVVREYTFRELRDACPCATCREKRIGGQPSEQQQGPLLPVLSAAEAQPLRVLGMEPVGHYAYSIRFSDGHDTGIYEFGLLRELGRAVDPAKRP